MATATPVLIHEIVQKIQNAHQNKLAFTAGEEMFCGVKEVFQDHASFLKYYTAIDTDFVYDKHSGLYFVGIRNITHVDFMATLYNYYTGRLAKDNFLSADQYILEGLGMFKSKAAHKIYHAQDFHLPVELKQIYRDMEIM